MIKIIISLISSFTFASNFIPKEFEANLNQIVKSRIGNKVSKQPLKLKYKFPKNVAMYVKDMTYICNSETTWRYVPPFIETQKGDVFIGKSSKHCFSTVFDTLKYGFKKNSVYSVVKNEKESSVNFEFSKKAQESLGVKSIEFKFDKKISDGLGLKDVTVMKLKYAQGSKKDTVYEVNKVKTDVEFKSSDFVFNIPKNTKKSYLE